MSQQRSAVAVNVILVLDITSLRWLNSSVSPIDGLPVIDISVTPLAGRNVLRNVAILGGFLGRKAEGGPGTQTIWIGLQKNQDYVYGILLAR